MRYYWDLIKHFFVSNSRHGTHSPFVYGLASNVIYQNSLAQPAKVNWPRDYNPSYRQLLSDILAYLNVGRLSELPPENAAKALWVDLQALDTVELLSAVRDGKILVVHEPFKTSATKKKWEELIKAEEVTVSINLFHFGLLLYREGQRKENFVLRYPFWRR